MGAGLAGCGGGAPPVASLPPPEVSVSQPIERAVSDSLEFTGRIEAVESVDVRARVSVGSLRQQLDFSFTEPRFTGRDVAAGIDVYGYRYDL